MTISVVVRDNLTHIPMKVNGDGEIFATINNHPPIDDRIESYPFSAFFVNTSNSNDMRVDGSTTPVEFAVKAVSDKDIFLKTISVRISDAGASLNEFGNLPALTNGVDFWYETPEIGAVEIETGIQTNLDFIRIGLATKAVGGGTNAFLSDISGGGADTYLPIIDLTQTFGFPWGLHLKKDTTAKLSFLVNDDLSAGIDTFNIKCFGTQL